MEEGTETSVVIAPTKTKVILANIARSMTKIVTLITEIAVVAVLGSVVGNYLMAKTIATDCHTVNFAKVGDVYVTCTIVSPKKDLPTEPPR